jgi:hypothetical protein
MANHYSAFGLPLGTATLADRRGALVSVSQLKKKIVLKDRRASVWSSNRLFLRIIEAARKEIRAEKMSRLKNWTRVLRDRSEAIG